MNYRDILLSLAKHFRSSTAEISRLVLTAPYQYKHYQIAKRTGGKRDIHHPTPALKSAQRWLTQCVLSELRVHDSVYSYRTGVGIKHHAAVHVHSNYILHLDFAEFFPSITSAWVTDFLLREVSAERLALDPNAIDLVSRLVCRYSKLDSSMALSIGAPSSPFLSNAILYDFDSYVFTLCSAKDCIYTRYADDIYVSTREKDVLGAVEDEIRRAIDNFAPRLRLNDRKTRHLSKKVHRVVTGLTLSTDRKVSLGRDVKRSIRTQIYLLTIGQLPTGQLSHLCGLVAYASDVEPAYFEALIRKFGADTMDRLKHGTF